ncbi:DUF349 domain-containing protein [Pseudoduganella sp. GCM10020061]|uniref:DUF349 domain-containing protein n=1 Tax=Pseudoduganella sp. GCM10020061 TaxID=3317345 RepID=UPI0036454FB9
MFEFLFKRPGENAGAPVPVPDPAVKPAMASPGDAARGAMAAELAALGSDEAAIADFILRCDYSELRLAAAERVYSPEHLERVYNAIRNSDRRVAKLMHFRLDTIRHHQAEMQRGEECLTLARQLAGADNLTPNQVAELDRRWSVISAPPLAPQFDEVRATLGRRLEAQVAQQRSVIDKLAALRKLAAERAAPDQLAQAADALDAALSDGESAALPRQLQAEAQAAIQQARTAPAPTPAPAAPAQAAATAAAPAEAPAAPAGAEAAHDLSAAPVEPAQPEAAAQPGPAQEARKHKPAKPALPPPDRAFLDKMDALDAALASGALHVASDLDKAMKETRGIKLSAAQAERLAHARSELKRLSDWARWGGNVSREQLVRSAEELQQQKLPMGELAQKVGGLRESWKKLDAVSGAAPRSLWERFDAACSAAYAPAAAHFKHLADERHASAAKGQALLDEAVREAEAFAQGQAPDWKHLASTVHRLELAWSHLGPIDRKDKKRLDAEFSRAMQQLSAPLAERREQEREQRERLIEQVRALNPQDRHALDKMKQAQEQWQQAARALPLERKMEQALWQKFRGACDEVFARRKESAHAADVERRAHQHAKEAICERLEQASDADGAARLLREAAADWHAAGPAPRAVEQRLEKRYHAAVSALQHKMDVARHAATLAQAGALRDKLRLVQELEEQLVAGTADAARLTERWAALAPLRQDLERLLGARFDAAIRALDADREAYARQLQANRDALLRDLLKLEISAGIDSGAEFARDRLRLQVEVLQSSLKSGQKPGAGSASFHSLLALPALSDARTAARIEHLYPRIVKDHK